MSVEKSEVIIAVLEDIGARAEDQLEAFKAEEQRIAGAVDAYRAGQAAVTTLLGHVDKDLESSQLDEAHAAVVKRYVERAVQMLSNLALRAEGQRFMAGGQVAAQRKVVSGLDKRRQEEQAKLQKERERSAAIETAIETATPVTGTIKQQRQAEEAASGAPPPEDHASDT